jgi:UrcA family protein
MPSLFRLDFSHTLGLVAIAPTVLGLGMIAAIATARADPEETVHVVLRQHGPANPRQMRHRIEMAALEVCGGGRGSLAEVNRTVRASRCWSDAVNDALAQAQQHP